MESGKACATLILNWIASLRRVPRLLQSARFLAHAGRQVSEYRARAVTATKVDAIAAWFLYSRMKIQFSLLSFDQ